MRKPHSLLTIPCLLLLLLNSENGLATKTTSRFCGKNSSVELLAQFKAAIDIRSPPTNPPIWIPEDTDPQSASTVYAIQSTNDGALQLQPGILSEVEESTKIQFLSSYNKKKFQPIQFGNVIAHPTKSDRIWIETNAKDDGTVSRWNFFKKILSVGKFQIGRPIKLELKCDDLESFLENPKDAKFPKIEAVSYYRMETREISKLKAFDNAFQAWHKDGEAPGFYIDSEFKEHFSNNGSETNEDPLLLLKIQTNCHMIPKWLHCLENHLLIRSKYAEKLDSQLANFSKEVRGLVCSAGGLSFYNFSTKNKYSLGFKEILKVCGSNHLISSNWSELSYRKKLFKAYFENIELMRPGKKVKSYETSASPTD